MWFFILIILTVLCWCNFKLQKHYAYWKERGVPHPKPLYILGNLGPTVFRKRSLADLIEDIYKKFPNEPYVGFYMFQRPTLLLLDPKLIKEIAIKSFNKFSDHMPFIPRDFDPWWNKNLFALSSKDGWYKMRTTINPAFTKYKIKCLFPAMQKCAKHFIDYIKYGDKTEIELIDVLSRYANDVMGTYLYRININSFKNNNCDFYVMSKKLLNVPGLNSLKFLGYIVYPKFMKFFNITIYNKKAIHFFTDLTTKILGSPRDPNRPSIIQILEQSRVDSHLETGHTTNQNEDIIAQALLISSGAFDTGSAFMYYTAYELAVNQDVQHNLHLEICNTLPDSSLPLTYETLVGMKYLDSVVAESLRLHPPILELDRHCVENHMLNSGDDDKKSLLVERGTTIWIPIRAIQRGAKYFPSPEKFIPERFNNNNKHNIEPHTYIPFGCGPRMCVGYNLAMLETKRMLVELLRNFKLVKTEKTASSIQLNKSHPFPVPSHKLYVGLKPRSPLPVS